MNKELSTFKKAEERVKISFFTKRGYDIKGVVHIGTNDWYELEFYLKMGIEKATGFEPLSEAYERMMVKFGNSLDFMSGQVGAYNIGLGNFNGFMTINVASGDGQSSTLLRPTKKYLKQFPDQEPIGTERVKIKRFSDFVKSHSEFNIFDYDCLVIDVEGYELEVLRGMEGLISRFKYLSIECSGSSVYQGGPSAQEVIDYLAEYGFERRTKIEDHNDIMFIRKDLL